MYLVYISLTHFYVIVFIGLKVKVRVSKKPSVEPSRITRSSSKEEKGNEEKRAAKAKGKKPLVEKEKLVGKKRQLVDEDSDFESRAGPSKKPKGKVEGVKKGGKGVKVVRDIPSIKNRCSPVAMMSIILGLSSEQKQCVRDMGFGALLNLKMLELPLKLGYYVIDRLNLESLCVELCNGRYLNVNSQSVHEMLGLPIGGIPLRDLEFVDEDDPDSCMFDWKNQFPSLKDLRLNKLKNQMLLSRAGDYNFIINFLVLFINTFCESTSMGKCNLAPLNHIKRDTDISKIDWCNYIFNCVIRTKNAYNPANTNSYFYGPVAYLVVSKFLFTFIYD